MTFIPPLPSFLIPRKPSPAGRWAWLFLFLLAASAQAADPASPFGRALNELEMATSHAEGKTAPGTSALSKEQVRDALLTIKQRSGMVTGKKLEGLQKAIQAFGSSYEAWIKAPEGSPGKAVAVEALRPALQAIIASYPAGALASMPAMWRCPMDNTVAQEPGGCPKCGMKMRVIRATQPDYVPEPILQGKVVTDGPLEVGKPVTGRLYLTFKKTGAPVALADLREVHTKLIHLLIVDPSLVDYHHEHPTSTLTPGEYDFSFTPRKPGVYRVWADLNPYETDEQEYVTVDLPAVTEGEPMPDKVTKLTSTMNGIKYDITLDKPVIRAKEPLFGRLTITGQDGQPFRNLEVLMGAFAHLVAFGDDYKSVLHIHPNTPAPPNSEAKGGPELPFVFRAENPGFVRFFAQVQIEGKNEFVPFGMVVEPGLVKCDCCGTMKPPDQTTQAKAKAKADAEATKNQSTE
jgi:Heavy metal binding domain